MGSLEYVEFHGQRWRLVSSMAAAVGASPSFDPVSPSDMALLSAEYSTLHTQELPCFAKPVFETLS